MLGTRTKQINAYGKRGRRVIDATSSASSNPSAASVEIISIFDDLPPAPLWTSVASRMRNRENAVLAKPRPPQPKVVGLQKKKRLSPVLSPIKKKQITRVAQLKGVESAPAEAQPAISKVPEKVKAKPTPIATGQPNDPIVLSASPPRAPLSSVLLNIPGSPAISQKPRLPAGKTPLKSNKPFLPFVDVEIIVLDDDGQTIRKERRVSKTSAEADIINHRPLPKASRPIILDCDSDEEAISQPRRPKRLAARKNIVVSDDSASEDDYVPPTSAATSAKAWKQQEPISKLSRTSTVEVVIPPAPYKISSEPLKSLPEKLITIPPPPPPKIQERHLQPRPPSPVPAQTRFQLASSPALKPRQLTPIRGGRKRLFEPPSPPSPTTPTDFDLSIDFSDLSLGDDSQSQPDFAAPDYLRPLLQECRQELCGPHNFSTFIESFPCDPILQTARQSDKLDMRFRKIGEASYSEVFGIGDVVLKVIPLRDESREGYHEDEDGPAPSDAKDVRKEIIVTRAMGEVYSGFVKLLKTYVVKGRYPEVLLQLWDEYNERKGSESVRPDTFRVEQIYAIIVLPNGGPDLEAYTFHNASRSGWRQACSLFWQVSKSLAHAEHLVSFEHRDLHWGQILVKNLPTHLNALRSLNTNQKAKPKGHRVYMDDLSHGVEATVIDLGLSRMDAGDGGCGERVHWTPFDDEVFMGEGDYQFDVYRMMRELTGGAWNQFHPVTNVLWLHYILQKLLHSKGLKPPSVPRKPKGTETPSPPTSETAFNEKDCYDCLVDIENWLANAIAELAPAGTHKATVKGKGRRKTQATVKPSGSSLGPVRAGEIVAYGVKKGWIMPTSLF